MSYTSIARAAADQNLTERITACVAQEQTVRGDPAIPAPVVMEVQWAVVSAADVAAAYESALAAGNENPGGDPSVVTDGMILSAVQAAWPDAPAP